MRHLFITLLSTVCYVLCAQAFADSIPIKAFQKCCGIKNCIEYPLRNSDLFVTSYSDQIFLRTDKEGIFYIDDTKADKMIMAYLARGEVILAGCHSLFTRSNTNKVVLEGLCPMDNCKII